MDKVSAEFYKNVLLLTKFVPPHDDLKKHFKEGMFEKPNTLGFIHVSYYLLNVHYKGNVKNKVQWPVICKQTENKFRNDVREFLTTLASENPDINFPPIFASHLLLAKGTKFILIMWKFSLVVLRTYLTREHHIVVSQSPKQGPCQDLSKTFMKNVIKDNHNDILHIRKERECAEPKAKNILKKKSQEQNELKTKLFQIKEDLKEVVTNAPVNDSGKKKLLNVEDDQILKMWEGFVEDMINSALEKDLKHLLEINEFLKSINSIVSNLRGNSQTLNSANFEKINLDPIYNLIPPEQQILLCNLYNQESLNLQNLFSIFSLLLQKFKTNSDQYQVEELNLCEKQLRICNADLKTVISHFQKLRDDITNFTQHDLKKTDDLNSSHITISSNPEFDKILFMPSPSIQINNYIEEERNYYQNYIKLTPQEGPHKQLFSRHANNHENGVYSTKKKPLYVQRINFDDSTAHDASSDKQSTSQQRFHTPSKLRSTFKNADKYSRLFSTRKPITNRVNNSVMMMMSSTGNSMLPLMTKHCISLMDSCNSSQEFSQEPLLMNPNLNSTVEPSKQLIKEEQDTLTQDKAPQKNSKRRSIGDLVERYKKLLQTRDSNVQMTNSPTKEHLSEDINA